jgi:hypothetical protein
METWHRYALAFVFIFAAMLFDVGGYISPFLVCSGIAALFLMMAFDRHLQRNLPIDSRHT